MVCQWKIDNEMLNQVMNFFYVEKAFEDAQCRKLEPGVDYPQKDVLPEMRVDCELCNILQRILI